MAKKNMIQREIKREKLEKKYYLKRLAIKEQLKKTTSFAEKIELRQKLQEMPRNSAPVRSRNRCWLTGRSRGYYRDFGLSRHVFREMSHECLLPGVTKSSW
uniref:Small ribosomal subunit protein uS14c n=1 Tax=Porphyra purpurea TaxID=2787 RepID=RR14_PORPU|nr:ribosomal protein S14 [Porphyra purpurea]P51319.1 RecName: Full=Small ribosomal subunit protein uS14c; AltName: Full=30S ribosomal protein S14, chloroplastic [Porphyra purpurea]AAC08205.1 30S ribosomal protein S14 [Porphyra purpurea]